MVSTEWGHDDAGQHGGPLTAGLETALDRGELELLYQPKVALDTDRVVGVEALLRWHHDGRTVSPVEFIPVAESTGLIIPIGAWVIDEACRQSAIWQGETHGIVGRSTSVNVSARQLGPQLVETVADAIERAGIPPSTLCLEITESMLMDDRSPAVATVRELATLGVRLSIDDFGTGFSSLAYLKLLPLDELKIDRSFVTGLGDSPDDSAIVAAVIAMAHALDLTVVAEGVETTAQLERLRTMGCDMAQGFLFARPLAAAALSNLLQREVAASWRTRGDEPPPGGDAYRADRVLIVDDADDVRQLARISLAAAGFDVYEAVGGAEAVRVASTVRPDCVLLDVVMPGISGLEVCRILRGTAATADCTILMLTGNDTASDKVDAFSFGADDYVVKPFSPRDLVGRVRAAIRRRRITAEGTGA